MSAKKFRQFQASARHHHHHHYWLDPLALTRSWPWGVAADDSMIETGLREYIAYGNKGGPKMLAAEDTNHNPDIERGPVHPSPARSSSAESDAPSTKPDPTTKQEPPAALETAVQSFDEYAAELDRDFADIRARLLPEQWHATKQLAYAYDILHENRQIIAPTGSGKTYVICATTAILRRRSPDRFDFIRRGTLPPMVVLPPAVIQDFQGVAAEFGEMLLITSLASLRHERVGSMLLDWRTIIINGQPQLYPFVRMQHAPPILWVDESQNVKNEDSTQSLIIESIAGHNVPVCPSSATPYSRVSQAKVIACALKPKIDGAWVLTPKNWPSFARHVCPNGTSPEHWSPAALERLQRYLEPYTVRWTVTYPHKIVTKLVGCSFATRTEQQIYQAAFDDWQEIRLKREKGLLDGVIAELVALQKFNQVAEELRAPHLAKAAVEMWLARETDPKHKQKFAMILGFAYTTALDRCAEALRMIFGEEEFNEKVCIIRGGQNNDRAKELFQSDKRPFLLLSIACGGAGLNLDHNKTNKRQRRMFCSAVWNDIQMAQLSGRTQRVKTLSASYLYVMYYEGTTERQKIDKVLRKIRCMKKITTNARVAGESDGGGTFVEDADTLKRYASEKGVYVPKDEDEEAAMAAQIVGTANSLDFTEEGDDENE